MRFEEAYELAEQGELITRPGYGDMFVARRGGRIVKGRFVGETGFADVRACTLTDEDRQAADWERFVRVLPDAWEGCDMPNAR